MRQFQRVPTSYDTENKETHIKSNVYQGTYILSFPFTTCQAANQC